MQQEHDHRHPRPAWHKEHDSNDALPDAKQRWNVTKRNPTKGAIDQVAGRTEMKRLENSEPEEHDRKANTKHALVMSVDELRNAPCHELSTQ